MKSGDKIVYNKDKKYIGTIKKIVKAISGGNNVRLFIIDWDGNPSIIPMRTGDEGRYPNNKGYLETELSLR